MTLGTAPKLNDTKEMTAEVYVGTILSVVGSKSSTESVWGAQPGVNSTPFRWFRLQKLLFPLLTALTSRVDSSLPAEAVSLCLLAFCWTTVGNSAHKQDGEWITTFSLDSWEWMKYPCFLPPPWYSSSVWHFSKFPCEIKLPSPTSIIVLIIHHLLAFFFFLAHFPLLRQWSLLPPNKTTCTQIFVSGLVEKSKWESFHSQKHAWYTQMMEFLPWSLVCGDPCCVITYREILSKKEKKVGDLLCLVPWSMRGKGGGRNWSCRIEVYSLVDTSRQVLLVKCN